MWTLTRLPQFHKAYRSSGPPWSTTEAAATLPFPKGLLVAIVLATPFWTAVVLVVHHLAR